MSEIEKMYENVEIEPKYIEGENLMEYSYGTLKYPPFTAEKQIELIKWLILNYSTEITKGRYTNYFMSTGRSYKASGNDDLIICMANLINNLWQDLTEEEKQQVKEILE